MRTWRRSFRSYSTRHRWASRKAHRRGRALRLECLESRELLAADLAITEFMAANDTTLSDSDGDFSDWIEIHNSGTDPVNLADWTLTDNADNLTKWSFPSLSIDPDDYLVVFASGKDRRPIGGELHTGFKLSAGGEYVALVSPAGVVVSQFDPDGSDYPPQFADISYGLPADGSAAGYLAVPTPGGANTVKRSETVAFDRPSGTFVEPFLLTLSAATPGATLRFTTDGSVPTEASPVYTQPISISSTAYVQAIALAPGQSPSTPAGAWYLKVGADLADFSSNLPVIVLENFSHGRPGEDAYQRNAMAIFEPDVASGRTSLLGAPSVETRAGLEIRGTTSRVRDKASYKLELRDDRNNDKPMSLLGMPSNSDWVLYGAYDIDRSLIRNAFIYALSNQVGRYAVRTRFVELYFNMNGGNVSAADYRGVYVLMEKIKRGPDRVNIQKLRPADNQEPEITGGWLLKIDSGDPGDRGFDGGGQGISYVDPKEQVVTAAQAAWIKDYFDALAAALTDRNPETGYAQYIDVDSWIDFHILNVMPVNLDAFFKSTFFYKDRGGKVVMGPIWDFDRSMESSDLRDTRPDVWNGHSEGTEYFTDHPWWEQLFQDPDFMQKWIDRWFELRRGVLSEENIVATIDAMAAEIAEAQARNFARWPGAAPRADFQSSYQVSALDGTWPGEVRQLKAWLVERVGWIDRQFLAPPRISPGAGRITLGEQIVVSAASGPIYYTTDGSDPRLPGGAINPAARQYDPNMPLVFAGNLAIIARALVDDRWSAPAEAQFLVAGAAGDARHLVVTELNYHPYDPTAAELTAAPGANAEDFEFIELANTGDWPIDLAGVSFADGLAFTFTGTARRWLAPGQYVLVVHDRAAFAARYGTDLPVAGQFARGALSNSGEQITLVDRYGVVVQSFRYDDAGQWPVLADGHGSCLEVVSTAGNYDKAGNWRGSSEYGGSPGTAGAGPVGDVVINEVLSRGAAGVADQIELYNTTAHAVDVSGWYLSDAVDDLRKAKLPAGTTLGPGQYVVLDVAQLGIDWDGPGGGRAWLIETGANGRPVRFADHVAFDGAPATVSLGRWPNGAGNGVLVPMANPSFGAANAGPVSGEIVVSEIEAFAGPLVAEDFADGRAEDFTPILGDWVVRDGGYEVTPGTEGDTIATLATDVPLPAHFVYSLVVNARTVEGFNKNAVIIFDCHSPIDFKFVSMYARSGKWRIGRRTPAGWQFLVTRKAPLESDTDVAVRVEVSGSSITLFAPGILYTYDFGTPLSDGRVGVGSKNGTARFEHVKLEWAGTARDFEFLELVNPTAAPIDLAGWQVAGAVDMTFASETTLDAGEVLVAVGFDPRDPEKVASFRERFAPPDSVVLVGPYAGQLKNDGDLVRLLQPVALGDENAGLMLVDQARYGAQPPWPTVADEPGMTLSRASAEAFGNSAASWSALPATPGQVRFAAAGDLDFDGNVDAEDIVGFVQVLADPAAYRAAYGVPAARVADVDGDGDVDVDDIDDFVALVVGSGAAAGQEAVVQLAAPVRTSALTGTPGGSVFSVGDGARVGERSSVWVDRRDEAHPHAPRPTANRRIQTSARRAHQPVRIRDAGHRQQYPSRHDQSARAVVTDHVMQTELTWRGPPAVHNTGRLMPRAGTAPRGIR